MALSEGINFSNKEKLSGIEIKIKQQIQESVYNYLTGNINNYPKDDYPKDVQKTIRQLKGEILDGCESFELKDIEIQQFVIEEVGKHHKRVNLVVKIGDTVKSLSAIIDENTNEVKNLISSDKYSKILEKDLEKGKNDNNILLRREYKENFKGVEIEEQKEGEEDGEFIKRLFDKMVYQKWNGIFIENKKQLEDAKTEEDKKQIIEENAEKMANLIRILQGTVEYTTWFSKDYFIHFLEKSPELAKFPEIKNSEKLEDGLIVVNGDYNFKLKTVEGQETVLPAHFSFVFEKQENGTWIIDGLHSYTD